MKQYPTAWQRKMMWAALTAFFVVVLVVILAAVIWTGASIISFLQPILIPVAIAVILTYLLGPAGDENVPWNTQAPRQSRYFLALRFLR